MPIAGGMALVRAWFNSWVNANLMVFMFLFNIIDRLNDYIFSLWIRLLLWRARSRETLHQAVARVDLRKVDKLVRNGASLSAPDDKLRTALHVVLDRLEELAAEEADAAEDAESAAADEAPIIATAAPTSMAMSRGPSKAPGMPRAPETARRRPSSADCLLMLRRLLEHPADVNAIDALERAPIHLSVRAGQHDATRWLLDAGADAALLSKGTSTLHQAAMGRDTQMVVLLLDAVKKASASGRGSTPPAEFVNVVGRDGWTALGLAARSGNAAMVMALLDAGADRAAVMKNGKTAGEIARLNKKGEVERLLDGA